MTAKDWLEKEKINNQKIYGRNENGGFLKDDVNRTFDLDKLLERYANEVSKEYQAKILIFYQKLKEKSEVSVIGGCIKMLESSEPIEKVLAFRDMLEELSCTEESTLLREYKKFFGITNYRSGEINEEDNLS